MADLSYPLTPDHRQQINNAIDALKQAQLQAERAQRAGVDTTAQQARIKDLTNSYQMIKAEYFPGG